MDERLTRNFLDTGPVEFKKLIGKKSNESVAKDNTIVFEYFAFGKVSSNRVKEIVDLVWLK